MTPTLRVADAMSFDRYESVREIAAAAQLDALLVRAALVRLLERPAWEGGALVECSGGLWRLVKPSVVVKEDRQC
jgi:hypothetical protein